VVNLEDTRNSIHTMSSFKETSGDHAISAESSQIRRDKSPISESVRRKLQPWKSDIVDLMRTGSDSSYLCSQCEIFPFKKCYESTNMECIWKSPLKRLLKHRNGCRLCGILLQALCQPENDPFAHPQINKHLPKEFPDDKRTMTAWLAGDASPWPFGKGQLSKDDQLGPTEMESSTHRLGKFGREALIVAGNLAAVAGSKNPAQSLQSRAQLMKAIDYYPEALPCYIEICTTNLAKGLLDAKLWGYGPGPRAPIAVLSCFRLRAESQENYNPFLERSTLSYGRLVDRTQIDLSIGRTWLQTCEDNHGRKCMEQSWFFENKSPTVLRFIDVKQSCIVEIHGPAVRHCRYVALSYVWGNSNKFTLNQGNIDTLVKRRGLSVLLNDLPRTIHDAITATENIGEQYLWVDSMCIQQDNELEKQEQIDVMDWVYGNAVLTFVAADASDADAGLRGVQKWISQCQTAGS
jgi:hypothetical protein